MSTTVTIEGQQEISGDSFAATLTNVSRGALEALALEGYRSGELTAYQVQQMLGFKSRVEVDGFLKAQGVPMEYSLEDLERDRATIKKLSGE